MKNKKGFILGDAVLSVVTIIVITFIMGAFVLIATGISIIKKPEIDKAKLSNLDKDSLLLQLITVKLKDNSVQQMFVYDAMLLWLKNELPQDNFFDSIKSLLNEEKNCLFILNQEEGFPKRYRFEDGSVNEKQYSVEHFMSIWETYLFKINEKTITIRYYFGPCPNEIK